MALPSLPTKGFGQAHRFLQVEADLSDNKNGHTRIALKRLDDDDDLSLFPQPYPTRVHRQHKEEYTETASRGISCLKRTNRSYARRRRR